MNKTLINNPSVGRDALLKCGTCQQIADKLQIQKQRVSDWLLGNVKPVGKHREIIYKIFDIKPKDWDLAPLPVPISIDVVKKRGRPKKVIDDGYAPVQAPATVFNQRLSTLEAVRQQISGISQQLIDPDRMQGSAYASLQNALRGYLKEEKDILQGLEDTECGWAKSESFGELVIKIYEVLKPFPDAIKALDTVFDDN